MTILKAYPITQAFGNVNPAIEKFSRGGVNYGTDIGTPVGTPISLPVGNWKVVEAYNGAQGKGYIGNNQNRGYGNSVLVQNTGTGEKLRFSHLSQVNVKPGQELMGGQIGVTGQTGNVTGPHLDLEYYDKTGRLADVTGTNYTNTISTRGGNLAELAKTQSFSQGRNLAQPQPQPQPQMQSPLSFMSLPSLPQVPTTETSAKRTQARRPGPDVTLGPTI